jgi:hypothetical protein
MARKSVVAGTPRHRRRLAPCQKFVEMEFAMALPGTSTLLDRHSKRVLVDIAEWRDRLEQLAEMRRATADSTARDSTVVDIRPVAP